MDFAELDQMIDQLKDLIKERTGLLSLYGAQTFTSPTKLGNVVRHDWRPVWELQREIQSMFNSGVRYPTRSEREQAWLKFNTVRNEASAAANAERVDFHEMSSYYRDEITRDALASRYDPLVDIVFIFDPTNIEDMKAKGRRLQRSAAHAEREQDENAKGA